MDHLLMVLLMLWSSGAQCETSAKADIVLVVDGSGSISPWSFRHVLSFVTDIVSAFDIGPDRVQIALVQYSSNPTTHWNLNTHQDKQALLTNVSSIQQLGGKTYTGLALNYILQNIFQPNVGMRADSEKIVVLITDGESTDLVDSQPQELKDAGIEVYTVGFNRVRESELRSIASDPKETHVYIVDDSESLRDIVNNLIINLCDSTKSSEPLRLVGGSSRCAGALEGKRGEWRPVFGSNWTLTSAAVVCRELHCGSVVSTGLRNGSTLKSAWEIRPDCVQSGSALRECVSPMWSSFFLEVTCSGPAVSHIGLVRLVLLSLALLLFITVLCVTHQATRGQKPGPQQNMELDHHNLGVPGAEEEAGEAAE